VPDGPALRVLLAEDNVVNQRVAVRLLEKQGHRVRVVTTGAAAVAAVRDGAFDLVLMDIQMPELDGLTATARIREAERGTGRHVPVVAMTAHAMAGDRERCLAAGMDDYLAKPFDPADLARVLGAHPAPDSPRAAVPAGAAEEPFDRAAVLKQFGGDASLLAEIVGAFAAECPRMAAALRAAGEAGDRTAVRRHAHSLKGSLSVLGPSAALDAARRVEQLAPSAEPPALRDEAERLAVAVDRFTAALGNPHPPEPTPEPVSARATTLP
jgi:CheY-like chemotaxis protein